MTCQLFERERKPTILTSWAQFCIVALDDWEVAGKQIENSVDSSSVEGPCGIPVVCN